MTNRRKLARALLGISLLTATLLLLSYCALLAINWHDEPVSTQAQTLIDSYNARPIPADQNNAQLYLLGFSAPPGQSPIKLGQNRIAWMRWALQQPNRAELLELEQQRPTPFTARTTSFSNLLDACESSSSECGALLIANEPVIDEWLQHEHFLLERYQGLLTRTDIYDPLPYDIFSGTPDYPTVFSGQRLLLTRAWLASRLGHAEQARHLLEADLRFWRMALAKADILLPKMIAVQAIKRHFIWGNLTLRQLPPKQLQAAIPACWQEPLSTEERSMRRTLSGEQSFSSRLIVQMKNGEFSGFHSDGGPPLQQRLLYSWGLPFLQPQASNNQNADFLLATEKTFSVPYEQLPKALEDVPTFQSKRRHNYLYNLTGNLLAAELGDDGFANYLMRVYDLEGIRRATLLLAILRSENVSRQDVASSAQQSELNNPYTAAPFTWNATTGELNVQGLSSNSKLTLSY
ncbi:hypothetical protein A9179_04630 [Pseudomonas alcaligenes]|uniref:Uncharacterized protein n=1 Tax=Aquipseudomonas alcaligenes TaxID=43263 RepID=A0ABR7RW53_AQUAC|nr:hypothetical protein [Pseudomonas alcaligenes]MBC9249561.1 hypothetical protein [Pseudomonas alcaligenes]